jgi:hypothetical protein
MMKTIALGAALVFGFATASSAAITPVPVGTGSDLTIRVAEGCGPRFWRGRAALAIHSREIGCALPDIISGLRASAAGRTRAFFERSGYRFA